MNGPEHYREAERLIAHARACTEGVAPEDCDTHGEFQELMEAARQDAQMDIAAAQVHATLALAAATALPQTSEMSTTDANEWTIATSASPAAVTFARTDLVTSAVTP